MIFCLHFYSLYWWCFFIPFTIALNDCLLFACYGSLCCCHIVAVCVTVTLWLFVLLSHCDCLIYCCIIQFIGDMFTWQTFALLSKYCFLWCWVGEFLLAFQDVALLPSWGSFSTTFLNDCGRGESLVYTTCLKTVDWGRQGSAPCEVLLLHKASFCVSYISFRS